MRHHKTLKQAERQNIPGRAEESGWVDKPGIKEPQNSLGMPSLAQVTQLSTWQHPGHTSAEHCKFNMAFPSVPGRQAPGKYRCIPPQHTPRVNHTPQLCTTSHSRDAGCCRSCSASPCCLRPGRPSLILTPRLLSGRAPV